ncbi:hypothetical protein [Microseira sp. BLCC-F43]|uniref:hypothetical protein n=1 Tax=Microseira sp. BLCC-F43 TaxID=3153602 RepID=UPI0035BB82B2
MTDNLVRIPVGISLAIANPTRWRTPARVQSLLVQPFVIQGRDRIDPRRGIERSGSKRSGKLTINCCRLRESAGAIPRTVDL